MLFYMFYIYIRNAETAISIPAGFLLLIFMTSTLLPHLCLLLSLPPPFAYQPQSSQNQTIKIPSPPAPLPLLYLSLTPRFCLYELTHLLLNHSNAVPLSCLLFYFLFFNSFSHIMFYLHYRHSFVFHPRFLYFRYLQFVY